MWILNANPAAIRPGCKNTRQRVSSGYLVHDKSVIYGRLLVVYHDSVIILVHNKSVINGRTLMLVIHHDSDINGLMD